MALTPADVHNVAFSRPRIGKRGYNEQEVDLFIDLVERELMRHLDEESQLRTQCAELRTRDGGLRKREVDLCEREAVLSQHECEVHRHESQLRQQEAHFAQRAAQLAKQGSPLPQQVALLRHREAQVGDREVQLAQHEGHLAQREAQLRQHEDELGRWECDIRRQEGELAQRDAELAQREGELAQREDELVQREAELQQWADEQRALVSCVGADAATGQVSRSYRHAQQLRAVPNGAAVNGAQHRDEARFVTSVQGRHDVDRMAIRAVNENSGNPIGNGGPGVAAGQPEQLEQLKKQNAELTRSLGLVKSATALLAAALECP